MDPFDTLGVTPSFALDLRALEERHRELSKALHPDRYIGAPAAERRQALGRAIDVNEAFRTLRDPVRRAEALLARAGVAVGETNEPKASPDMLMEMMEAREELSEAAAESLDKVHALAERMQARKRDVESALGKELDAAHGDREQLARVLPRLGELRYVRRFLDEVGAIEDRLSP